MMGTKKVDCYHPPLGFRGLSSTGILITAPAMLQTSGNDVFYRNPYSIEENVFVNVRVFAALTVASPCKMSSACHSLSFRRKRGPRPNESISVMRAAVIAVLIKLCNCGRSRSAGTGEALFLAGCFPIP